MTPEQVRALSDTELSTIAQLLATKIEIKKLRCSKEYQDSSDYLLQDGTLTDIQNINSILEALTGLGFY